MKILAFKYKKKYKVGFKKDNVIYDLSNYFKDIKDLVENFKNLDSLCINYNELIINELEITYLPPLIASNKIICVGLNYFDHVNETGNIKPDYPVFFARYPSSIVGHNNDIIKSKLSDKYDYEGELAIVIAKKANNIKASEAWDYIFGYSIFNDVTIRDFQKLSSQWLVGKNFDGSGSFGPYITTIDEFDSPFPNLKIITRLNGNVLQNDYTSNMIFNIPEILVKITSAITLEPGDIIVTGTPSGVGYKQTPPIYLQKNDICEIEITNLGILKNKVI